MHKLFNNDKVDSEELNINSEYAKNYDNWRHKEELHKLKARYGEDAELLLRSGEESSESSEDDEGEEISEDFEKNFYKTLACLKNKDPKIYNEKVKFFTEPEQKDLENGKTKEKKEKSLFLRDYERKIIVERGGKFSDSEDEDENKTQEQENPTYVQEQQQLKESFKKVLQDEEDDDILKPKSTTAEEKQKEEDDYKEWLKGQKKHINEEEQKELKPLRDFWTDPKLDASEKFLRDYVLNKKFLDKNLTEADVSYDHRVHDSDENLSEDEKNIDKQEEFEHKYNFRFQEPDQEFIKRYPRTLENSLRKKDTRRAEKRAEVKIRKDHEKLKKQEELKQLKALKRKEIEEKIEKLKEITGNDDLQLNLMDLEKDFDPDEYDKKMSEIFNEDYYAGEEGDSKPQFPEIDEELCVESTWDNYDPNTEEIASDTKPYHDGPDCEDPDFNMDADYDGQKSLQDEMVESSRKKKRRRRSKFAEMLSKEKPKFDPTTHSSFQEYYDQYYALDYEDMIGDLPCRFKYRQVVPNNFGLSVEEILMADDKELNKWCSLKKALQYKPEHQELNDVQMYRQKAANDALKRKVLKSLYAIEEENDDPDTLLNQEQQDAKKKRKRKKKNQNSKTEVNQDTNEGETKNFSEVKIKQEDHQDDMPKNKVESSKKSKNFTGVKIKQEVNQDDMPKNKVESSKKSKNFTEVEIKQEVDQDDMPKNKVEKNEKKRKYKELEDHGETKTIEKKKKKKLHKINKDKTFSTLSVESIENKQTLDISENGKHTTKPNKTQNKNIFNTKKQKNKNKQKNNKIEKSEMSKKEKRKLKFKKSQNKKGESNESDQLASLSAERLKAYGFNPKKFKNKLKYKKKD